MAGGLSLHPQPDRSRAEGSCTQGRSWYHQSEVPCPPRRTDRQHEEEAGLETSLTASSGHGDLPLPKAQQHWSPCVAAPGAMPLCSTGCRQRAWKAAQHRWHGRGKAEIWCFHHCHLLCSDSGVRATAHQQCPKLDLTKGPVKCTTNPKPPPSLHAHNPQQQDRGSKDSES